MLKVILTALTMLAFGSAPMLAQSQDSFDERNVFRAESWERENWSTDFSKYNVNFAEIIDVIGRDQIPSMDAPEFTQVGEETRIPGIEPVIALDFNGVQRAYPIRYLMWHEIVNDVVAGEPLAVTYCPLCNSSAVFKRVLRGETVEFGTTGKLRNSDLLMYDRTSQTWWQQFNGLGVVGALTDEKLEVVPSSLISFDQFVERYPEGQVLLPDANRVSSAGRNPYVGYDGSTVPFLFRGELPEDINAMERVALVQITEPPIAVSISHLNENPQVKIGDLEFRWQAGQSSALDAGTISGGRDVGSIEVFDVSSGEDVLVPYMVSFAFAARSFYPELEIVQ